LITDTSIAPINAALKVLTVKPLMTVPRNQNTKPFITREKRPKVTILSGSVSIVIIGFTNILNSVRQAPTTRATYIGLIVIPETTYVVAHTATESIRKRKIIFISLEVGTL